MIAYGKNDFAEVLKNLDTIDIDVKIILLQVSK